MLIYVYYTFTSIGHTHTSDRGKYHNTDTLTIHSINTL